MQTPLTFKIIEHNSTEYKKLVELRYDILRKPLGLNFTKEQLSAENKDFHLAAYMQNELAACLLMLPLDDKIVKMRQVAVREDLQGKGIGRQLVLFSEKWALENGFQKMELNARENAVPFYLSMNYKKTGQPFIEVGLVHFKMYKLLKPAYFST